MKKALLSKDWTLHAPHFHGQVDLPNDYAVTAPRDPHAPGGGDNGYFVCGNGHYHKDLEFADPARHYILDVDGAYMNTEVKLNDYILVKHPHGYTPMLVDLTGRIRAGEKNHMEITTRAMHPSSRWYTGAGIYRDLFLWEGGDIRIEPWDKFITTPTLDTVQASYEISADRAADVTVKAHVLDGETVVASAEEATRVTAEGKTKVEFTIHLPDAKLWDTETPYLYTLRTVILENGTEVETDETRFGVRTITADMDNGLRLNGKTIKLRGGCIHHDHGVLGAADYPAACRRKLTKLKDAGFNAVRIAHNPPSTNLLEICDEMGMIVMDEAFDCWRRTRPSTAGEDSRAESITTTSGSTIGGHGIFPTWCFVTAITPA